MRPLRPSVAAVNGDAAHESIAQTLKAAGLTPPPDFWSVVHRLDGSDWMNLT
jgi:hypothetical protein